MNGSVGLECFDINDCADNESFGIVSMFDQCSGAIMYNRLLI